MPKLNEDTITQIASSMAQTIHGAHITDAGGYLEKAREFAAFMLAMHDTDPDDLVVDEEPEGEDAQADDGDHPDPNLQSGSGALGDANAGLTATADPLAERPMQAQGQVTGGQQSGTLQNDPTLQG